MSENIVDQVIGDDTTATTKASNKDQESTSTKSVLDELVGENKPFKDVEALAKAKLESNRFIEQLKEENREMREALKELEEKANRNIALSDILNEVKNAANKEGGEESNNQTSLTETDVAELVERVLEQKQQTQRITSNKKFVELTIKEAFGGDEAKAVEFLKTRTAEVGLNADTVKNLIESSPKAFLKLIGIDPSTKGNKESSGDRPLVNVQRSVNTDSTVFANTRKNYEYFRKLRKEMGVAKFYSDTRLLNEMYAERQRQGDDFYK